MGNDSEEGLDIPLVLKCKKKVGSISGCYCAGGVCDMSKGKTISNPPISAKESRIL